MIVKINTFRDMIIINTGLFKKMIQKYKYLLLTNRRMNIPCRLHEPTFRKRENY